MFWLIILGLLAALVYFTNKFDRHYEDQGLFAIKPYPFFGSFPSSFFKPTGLLNFGLKTLTYGDHDLWVYYTLGKPVLVINKPEFMKEIFVKHFDHFVDRRTFKEVNEVIVFSFSLFSHLSFFHFIGQQIRQVLGQSFLEIDQVFCS